MSKAKLFDDDSDEEVEIKTENEYAKRYDAWREKEELHKLEQKYGSKALNTEGDDSTDSEDESDVPPEVSDEVEKQFLKTLSLLKTKDPRIYDPNFKCFDDKIEKEKVFDGATKKKRSENWSAEEKVILRKMIAQSRHIIEDKSTKTSTNIKKAQEWKNIAKKMNERMGKNRSDKEVKLAWKRMKVAAKANLSTHGQDQMKTGGGEKPKSPSQGDLANMNISPHAFVVEYTDCDSYAIKTVVELNSLEDIAPKAGPSTDFSPIIEPPPGFNDEVVEVMMDQEQEPETKKLTFGDSDDDDDDPNIFSIEKKAEIDNDEKHKENKKDEKIKEFLIGKADHIDDDVEKDLAPLRALWSDPKLNDGEAFLRDYILNKRYLEDGDAGDAAEQVRDDEDLEQDERLVEEQGAFERAYNFRFEEPDDQFAEKRKTSDYIRIEAVLRLKHFMAKRKIEMQIFNAKLKRFPRTMNYIRPKDDKRSKKRAEIRERKEQEKKKKMEEIARLKALKLKEIQEKIAKIKEVTGNKDLAFQEEDIEGDFDPEEHDKRMKALFDEEYYGEADDQKPVFPDLDEELEIENWDNYEQEYDQENGNEDEPHCEDKDFNMDADYDPRKAKEDLIEELKRNMGKKRRNRKRKSKLAEILAVEKPKFIPDIDKTYDEYMQEYYKMDCEDVIGGDLPTRFKYREVVPNDFGLTVEEILLADDKELTQWVPLKKIVKYRPENVEKSEIKTYQLKSADDRLKKKILPSLFKNLPEEPELVVPIEASKKKKKKKKKKKQKVTENTQEQDVPEETIDETQNNSTEFPKKKKNKRIENRDNDASKDISMDISQDGSNENKKIKKKHKKEHIENDINEGIFQVETQDKSEYQPEVTNSENKTLKKKHRKNSENVNEETSVGVQESNNTSNKNNEQKDGKKKKKKAKDSFNIETVSDKVTPSNVSSQDNTNSSNKDISNENNLKRKLDATEDSTPKKKKKKNKNKQSNNSQQSNNNKKDFHKFNKNKNKQNDKANNPFSQISDERLKAYGLNPKKYRSFLKYKKY